MMRLTKRHTGFAVLAAWAVLACGAILAADRLVLQDGQVIEGHIVSMDRRDVRIETTEGTIRVPRFVIETVERDDTPRPADDPTPAVTPELSAWLDLCVQHLQSDDEGVRRGAEAALRVAGAAARGSLERATQATGEIPKAVTQLLDQLDRREALAARVQTSGREERGWVSPDLLARSLALREEQVEPFSQALTSFREESDALGRSLAAGELEQTEADDAFSELRSSVERELGEILDEAQMERCLRLLPEKLPRP